MRSKLSPLKSGLTPTYDLKVKPKAGASRSSFLFSPMSDFSFEIVEADTAALIAQCHPVMLELRPHHGAVERFVELVLRLRSGGYRLACLIHEGVVRSVTCFEEKENLSWGRHLYVHELVTRAVDHGHGYGSALFDWLVAEARRLKCQQFHLDSGVQRFDAHRFYLHKGMNIVAHHFALNL